MLSLNPSNLKALWNKGNVLFDLNRYEDAIKSYDQFLIEIPNFLEILEKKAEAMINLNKPQEAIECYKDFIENKTDAQKLDWFDKILKIDKNNVWALMKKH